MIFEVELRGIKKDIARFAGHCLMRPIRDCYPLIPANTDGPHSRKGDLDICNLKIERFLNAENIRPIVADAVDENLLAIAPGVERIMSRAIANVECHDGNVVARRLLGTGQIAGKDQDSTE